MARSFNGSTDRIDTSGNYTFVANNLTFSAWINPSSVTGTQCIVRNQAGAGSTGLFAAYLTGTTFAGMTTTGSLSNSTFTTIAIGLTYHLLITDNGTTRSFYVNGVAVGTSVTGVGALTTSALRMGNDASSQPFTGNISDVAFWNTILTATEIAALASGVRPSRIQRTKLGGYWPLEGTASPEPDVINGNNGTLTGTSSAANPFNYTTPKYGSRSFSGTNNISISNIAAYPTDYPFTIAAWIFPTSSTTDGEIFVRNATGSQWVELRHDLSSNGFVNFTVVMSNSPPTAHTANSVTTTSSILNKWTHVAGTLENTPASGIKIWINGVNEASAAFTSGDHLNTSLSPGNWGIGRDVVNGSNTFAGQIADVAIWNTNLSAAQMQLLAKGYRPHQVNIANLVAYWPCDGSASPEVDMVAANNGTVTGATAASSPTTYQDVVGA